MPAARTARQKAAARRNLVKARAKRRRGRNRAGVKLNRKAKALRVAGYAGNALLVSSVLIGPGNTARVVGGSAKAGGRYAKGFAKGYSTSRNRHKAARRNLARHNMGRATAHRVPQLAIAQHGSYVPRRRRA